MNGPRGSKRVGQRASARRLCRCRSGFRAGRCFSGLPASPGSCHAGSLRSGAAVRRGQGMVSVGVIGGSGGDGRSAGYYTSSVAKGRDDYYTGRGEAPGEWFGAGAWALGLEGEVDADEFRKVVMEATDPVSGERLRRPAQPASGARRRHDLLGAQVGVAGLLPRRRTGPRGGGPDHHRVPDRGGPTLVTA